VHSKVHRIPRPFLFQWFLCTAQAKKLCLACIGFAVMRPNNLQWRKTAQRRRGRSRVFMDLYAPECGRIICAIGSKGWGGTLPA
jgi:hypothetical protein